MRLVKKQYRNKGSKDNLVISICGAHGVGKSTVFNLLKKELDGDNKFKFYPERYVKNPPFPFGSSDKQIAFRSELHFLQQFIKRNQSIVNYDNRYNGRILLLDRTPICVLVYSKSLYLKEKDFELILDTYKSIKWRMDYHIYLTAEPETIMERIIRRGSLDKIRKEWNEEEEDYLLEILTYYKQYLLSKIEKNRLFVVQTDGLTPEEVKEKVKNIITDLSDYSFEKKTDLPSDQMDLLNFIK